MICRRQLAIGCRFSALAIFTLSAIATEPILLENDFVRVSVDALHGGAVTAMAYKKAHSFDFIADKGAGIAGSGSLFAPVVESAGKTADALTLRATRSGGRAITLSGSLADGLSLERRFQMGAQQSGFSITDVIDNDSARDVSVRVGATSRQQAAPWRWTDRSWIGDQTSVIARHTPSTDSSPVRLETGGTFFWRQIEQYGTGFLYRVKAPVNAAVELGEDVVWKSQSLVVPAHGRVAVQSEVWIDEGGGAPDQHNAFASVLVRSDAAAAGRSGQPLTAFATVVSPVPRQVRISVSTDRELTHADVTLVPGKVARVPLAFSPSGKGDLAIHATVAENGHELGAATAHALIDGDPSSEIWKNYVSRMPEEHYHGTWEEIGEQVARNRNHIGAPTTVQIAPRKNPAFDGDLSFYRKRFPYYTDLIAGVAKAAGVAPARLALVDRAAQDKEACMDLAFYGPDGPINAFSKERSSTSFKGLGYLKVVPAKGYPFHIYMSVGVNSEGLSTSSATLNEDERTRAADFKALEDWKRSGKHVMPPAVSMWMLLSMCRNVEEALAMIRNPEAPLEFTGNMLLLDRAGNAARVESVGIDHQIFRGGKDSGFFVAGNYPHERADGMFRIGPRPGWAANTMLRERFLEQYAGGRQGRLSLQDVVSLMQTHEAGGMCQHIYDNPGQLYTSCSYIAVTRTSELWLSQGPPCQVHYVRHNLEP
jgi:hypothetical protein